MGAENGGLKTLEQSVIARFLLGHKLVQIYPPPLPRYEDGELAYNQKAVDWEVQVEAFLAEMKQNCDACTLAGETTGNGPGDEVNCSTLGGIRDVYIAEVKAEKNLTTERWLEILTVALCNPKLDTESDQG
jgi:hypothetical protein